MRRKMAKINERIRKLEENNSNKIRLKAVKDLDGSWKINNKEIMEDEMEKLIGAGYEIIRLVIQRDNRQKELSL